MTKIDKIVSHSLFKFVMPFIGTIFIGMCTLIYQQGLSWAEAQGRSIHENKVAIKEHCDRSDLKMNKKVDNQTLLDYMERNAVEHKRLNDRIEKNETRQEKTNDKLIETLQNIQIEMAKD